MVELKDLAEMEPIVSQWIRERGTCMDGASYAAALELAAYVAARRTTPDREAWISVDERLPEPDEPVLAHNGKWTGVAAWMSGDYLEPIERWQDERREFIELLGPAITHWMPLPTAPTSDKGGA